MINSRDHVSTDTRVGALWSLDLETGRASLQGRSRIQEYFFVEGMAFRDEERLYGVDDQTNTLVRIGTESGNAIAVAQTQGNLGLPSGNHDFGVTFTCDGRLLISTDSVSLGVGLYEANPETGELSRIGNTGAPIVDMASVGEQVFGIGRGMASDAQPASPNLYRLDVETGRAELVGPLGAEVDLYNKAGLAADADGTLWAVTDRRDPARSDDSIGSQVLRIDPSTGRAERVTETRAADTGGELIGIESLAIAPPGACERGAPTEPSAIPVMSPAGLWAMLVLVFILAVAPLRRLGGN
ncbi:hypothetical protein [Wenzhouxiangella sediminis]|uniref:DUF4394 domain-containing protein n=1 Tax=Wenzhouxiangella sediminis TaxID=1792836 RepID=A0A3E1K7X8_9GAMM|nr:hypothetical protein [Wenzhouxiangella sediminis]RFF30174.1 hypothetical protein DZC52_08840 [Wenzhouxiangella sediminis]